MKINTRHVAFTGLLVALEILLQFLGNYVALGPINLNLSLIPLVIGAIVFGPFIGAFLGLINGAITLLSPSTLTVFMPINIGGTILTCLIKGVLCGFLSGMIFKLFKNKNIIASSVITAICAPIINSGIFAGFCLLFFQEFLKNAGSQFPSPIAFLFLGVIGWNFIFELLSTTILSPSIIKIINIIKKKDHSI